MVSKQDAPCNDFFLPSPLTSNIRYSSLRQEEERFLYALVDGRKEKLGNFRVEPPGLFRGRGAHPKMGKLKARIFPEDITLNMSKKAAVPQVPDIGDGKKHKCALSSPSLSVALSPLPAPSLVLGGAPSSTRTP